VQSVVLFRYLWGRSLLSSGQKKSFAFAAGVIFTVMTPGLKTTHMPILADTAWQEYYHRLALKAVKRASLSDYRNCSQVQSGNTLIPVPFMFAIAAVENYGRPPLRRWIEQYLAKTSMALTGQVPDYSLGVGQLRLSTARDVIHQNTPMKYGYTTYDDAKLLEIVLNPCENLKTVLDYLNLLMEKSGLTNFDKSAAEIILKHYNGQRSLGQINQTYREVVWEVFRILSNSMVSTDNVHGWNETWDRAGNTLFIESSSRTHS
jgi:hypothetical protein